MRRRREPEQPTNHTAPLVDGDRIVPPGGRRLADLLADQPATVSTARSRRAARRARERAARRAEGDWPGADR